VTRGLTLVRREEEQAVLCRNSLRGLKRSKTLQQSVLRPPQRPPNLADCGKDARHGFRELWKPPFDNEGVWHDFRHQKNYMPFAKLGLTKPLSRGVQSMGYGDPTPIQLRAIPPALEGRDVIASAQTGTGKTAAFALPALQHLGTRGTLRCLVLEPTRELAMQVETSIRDLARMTSLRVASIYGGVSYKSQREAMRRGLDVIVATPGRLEDYLAHGDLRLSDLKIVVLDEVDRMLDVGFLPAVKRILSQCPTDRQTLFFSATLPPEIADLADWALRNPMRIETAAGRPVATMITHGVYAVEAAQKFALLVALLEATDYQSALVFARTKHGADKIAKKLRSANHAVAVLHANRTQNQRIEALSGFKSGRYEVMVATDIAARGIDVAGVSHVINYDVPQHPEDYVHRIGRTGRAQRTGDAFTLVTADEFKKLAAMERFIGQRIERLAMKGFAVVSAPMRDQPKPLRPNTSEFRNRRALQRLRPNHNNR
jgi:ATP-dependent RNA helicase RhlE